MSRGSWDREKLSGLRSRLFDGFGRHFLNEEGNLRPERFPDCDLFNVSSCAAVAGYANPSRFKQVALNDPRFHHHRIEDPEGRLVTIATHTTSAQAYGALLRAESVQHSRGNLLRGPAEPKPAARVRQVEADRATADKPKVWKLG